MKKNISINLFGSLYSIDEDAYLLLKRYLDNMKSYFEGKEGGDEIADDIEHRVAEHLWDMKNAGVEAIDIIMVKDMINKIGNPEEINDSEIADDNDDSGNTIFEVSMSIEKDEHFEKIKDRVSKFGKWFKSRVLHRDGQDKLIGGVASGFSHFFGGVGPLLWRILFILLAFLTQGVFVVVYLLLWIIVPLARTAEQRLLMKGIEVTPQNINEEIVNGMSTEIEIVRPKDKTTSVTGCLGSIVGFFVSVAKGALLIVSFGLLIAVVACLVPLCILSFDVAEFTRLTGTMMFETVVEIFPAVYVYSWTIALCAFVAAVIPVVVLLRWISKTPKAWSSSSKSLLVILWVISLTVCIVLSIYVMMIFDKARKICHDDSYAEYVEENTRDGIFLDNASWQYLDFLEIDLLQYENGLPDVEGYSYNHPLGFDCSYLKFDCNDRKKSFNVHAVKNMTLDKGTYCFEALVRSKGYGNHLYLTSGSDSLTISLIDSDTASVDNRTSIIEKIEDITWENCRELPLLSEVRDSVEWEKIRSKSSEWIYVSKEIKHDGGPLTLGFRMGKQANVVSLGGGPCYMYISELGIRKY